jgi:class 3 adenylate cyclase/tetratricopeptide (TPR) repeat protein
MDLLQILAAYVPPPIVRAALSEAPSTAPSTAKAERFPAAVLFADVSGFTPLTEALAQRGSEGPEELTRLLNGYFSRMISLIEAEGGQVIQFSGDAVTAIFPALQDDLGVATRRALQTAEAMQAAMVEFTTLETSAGPVALGMKIGVGAGEILAAQVGGLFDRWEYVIAGDPLRQVAQAEHRAGRGEIVLSPEAQAVVVPDAVPPLPLHQPDWASIQHPAGVEAILRRYVPGVVSAWLEEELQEWLAVLRPMSVLFIGITGIDYAHPDAVERLHTFMRAAQETVRRYEGSINKLAVDDKGTILLLLFGAPPRAHEDDPERALRCALDLQAMAETQELRLAVGVTTGRVFAGPVGSETRREYTVMGNSVNLAARLMGVAGEGQTRCDYDTYHSARDRLDFDLLPSIRVKGKAGLIRVYSPTGEVHTGEEKTRGALVGRRTEVGRLETCLDDVQAGHSRILIIEGEAGIGKSRLVEELVRLTREHGVAGLMGMGRSVEQHTPYRAWRDIFNSYFDLDEVDDPAERRHQVQVHVRDVTPDLVERLPLLNDVLSLGLPENELTASLDTHLRHESLVSLLLALLHAWAVERPLALILEDAHWLDSLSWDLTVQVARALTIAQAPLLLVVAMRPLEGEHARVEPQALASMSQAESMSLEYLSPEETLTLAATRLGVSEGDLPEAVAELVRTRSGGNPFFAEELIYALRDEGLVAIKTERGKTRCVVQGDLDRAVQTLPDTIQGIVLSRIDRLPPEEQLTLKVAAVIGRTFAYPTLHDALGEHMEVGHRLLKAYLDDLANLDLTPLEAPEPELTYIFKHIITQEVAYETLLFAQRRQLHRTVAGWYERVFGDEAEGTTEEPPRFPPYGKEGTESSLAPYYPLLVYHWHQAGAEEQERRYAILAGKWAAAQFANVEAAGYLSRALELTPEGDLTTRYDLLLAREAVNNLRGEREAQAQDLVTLVNIAKEGDDDHIGARVALRLANYQEVTSDYPAALVAVQSAVKLAARAHDLATEIECHITWGKVLWRQGDYAAARAPLERALTLARNADPATSPQRGGRLGGPRSSGPRTKGSGARNRRSEAQSLHSLGNVYLSQGDYTAAEEHYQEALNIRRAEGHRQGEADSLSVLGVIHDELGDYSAARDYYEQALTIYHATGDRRGQTMALSNLGVVYCDMGDYEAARENHQQALELRRTIGDRWGEAVSLVNLGLVYQGLGDHEAAREHCQQALAIQREIGDRRGQGYSLTYLGRALESLAAYDAAAGAYDAAMQLRRELGQHSLAIDDLAGLARVTLAQSEPNRAREHVTEILAWIETNGSEGIEYPLQVCLSCYRVLSTTGQKDSSAAEQAHAILSKAHSALQEQAAGISDQALRRKFLENVEAHRELMAAWKAQETPL